MHDRTKPQEHVNNFNAPEEAMQESNQGNADEGTSPWRLLLVSS